MNDEYCLTKEINNENSKKRNKIFKGMNNI